MLKSWNFIVVAIGIRFSFYFALLSTHFIHSDKTLSYFLTICPPWWPISLPLLQYILIYVRLHQSLSPEQRSQSMPLWYLYQLFTKRRKNREGFTILTIYYLAIWAQDSNCMSFMYFVIHLVILPARSIHISIKNIQTLKTYVDFLTFISTLP